MSSIEKTKLVGDRAFMGKLDEMIFRLKHIFPNGNMKKDFERKNNQELNVLALDKDKQDPAASLEEPSINKKL